MTRTPDDKAPRAETREQARRRLAELIGGLLARHWLRTRHVQARHGGAPAGGATDEPSGLASEGMSPAS
jgi:hypothetical protein